MHELLLGECQEIIPTLEISINCLLTDPPYGLDYQSTFGKDEGDREKYQRKIDADADVQGALDTFAKMMDLTIPLLAEQAEIYVFSHWRVAPLWQEYLGSLSDRGVDLMQLLIWNKGYPGIGDVKYNWGAGHEFIYYLKKGRRRVPYRRDGILAINKVRPGTNIHPSEKPQGLLKILIEYSTDEGDLVFDPFAGSGSALLAARDLGRNAIGIEYDAQYHADASHRLEGGSLFTL